MPSDLPPILSSEADPNLEESDSLLPSNGEGSQIAQPPRLLASRVTTTNTPLSLLPRLTLMAAPVPVLLMLNEALFQGQVDRLHCILFQLLVMVLVQMVQMSRVSQGSIGDRAETTTLASADPVLDLAAHYTLPRKRPSPSPSHHIPPHRHILSSPHASPSTLVTPSPQTRSHIPSPEIKTEEGKSSSPSPPPTTTSPPSPLSSLEKECSGLVREFLAMANQDPEVSTDWALVHTQTSPFPLRVHRHQEAGFRYRIDATIPVASGTAFDLLADPTRRMEWDDMCAHSGIIQSLSTSTNVTHVQTKPVWPTAARDLCLLSHIRRLSVREGGGLLGVTRSTTHPDCPADPTGKVVRMYAGVAGQWIRPVKDSNTGKAKKDACMVLQLVEGDLKGWIPGSVVKYVATKAIPQGFIKLVHQLQKVPPPHSEDTGLLPPGYTEKEEKEKEEKEKEEKEEKEGGEKGGSILAPSPPPSPPPNPTGEETEGSRTIPSSHPPRPGSPGSSSPVTLSSLQFRIRRLEAQVTGLLGALPPRLTHHHPRSGVVRGAKSGKEVGFIRRIVQGGMGVVALGAWTAAILYVLRRLR
ncbi:MAG: hypothetical protein DHS80DRAFT_30745 [Piptocephalis tieghemiana]|nr:MAG: hypothetical protein DHS80DRAFT_30745 [Piptocephalis tieghemiana]